MLPLIMRYGEREIEGGRGKEREREGGRKRRGEGNKREREYQSTLLTNTVHVHVQRTSLGLAIITEVAGSYPCQRT